MESWIRLTEVLYVLFAVVITTKGASDTSQFETVLTSNAAIFNRMGLVRLEIPDGHHKKRLAGPEPQNGKIPLSLLHQAYGRRHGGHQDSHVYIVKLPPSQPFYSLNKPQPDLSTGKLSSNNGLVRLDSSFNFAGNGKPNKVYHWNLPIMKKMNDKKRQLLRARLDQSKVKQSMNHFVHWKKASDSPRNKVDETKLMKSRINSLQKHARNNDKRLSYPDEKLQLDNRNESKSFRLGDSTITKIENQNVNSKPWRELSNELHASKNSVEERPKKHRKKAVMSYYAPHPAAKAGPTSIHKSFSGNGKPKAFYVMEKSRTKPIYYHPLLP